MINSLSDYPCDTINVSPYTAQSLKVIDNSKHNLGVKAFCTLNIQFYFRELSQ